MNMGAVRLLFLIAAAYDGVLGGVFLIAPHYPFELMEITPPNHFGYVQFAAALLLIFGCMFLEVARDPVGNRPLILYGMLLKMAYCGLVAYYWLNEPPMVPMVWKIFAGVDLAMLLLFLLSYMALAAPARSQRAY
jgi:hypothetical protein